MALGVLLGCWVWTAGAAAPAADAPQRPTIVKRGTLGLDLCETTPFVFHGKVYRLEWFRNGSILRIMDRDAHREVSRFGAKHRFPCAYVENDTVYVVGTKETHGWYGETLTLFTSKDLTNWTERLLFNRPGMGICNTSICKTDSGYVMSIEQTSPAGFPARFLESKDLLHWTLLPEECRHNLGRYNAAHCLRWHDGWYYLFYLEAEKPHGYEQYITRSRDLIRWESSPLNPVLAASPEDKRILNPTLNEKERAEIAANGDTNNSDIDFCEFQGRLIINYCWGTQGGPGHEYVAEAEFNGSLAAFLTGWFPAPEKRAQAANTGFARVSNYRGVFTEPPRHVPTPGMPDGPLLGNGDVGVVLAGPPEAQRFHLGKNDFWRRAPADASIVTVGAIHLSVPALKGASYRQEQDLARAQVSGVFAREGVKLCTRSWMQASENLLIASVRNEGGEPLTFTVGQTVGALNPDPTKSGQAKDAQSARGVEAETNEAGPTLWFTRKADALPGRAREVAVATRIVGARSYVDGTNGVRATLAPGQSAWVVSAVLSDLDAPEFLAAARERVAALRSSEELDKLGERHRAWWTDFWARSFIEIPDPEIEKRWYAALYTLGSCSRAGKVAPGLWGNWITTDRPNWHGDLHLNYNFQAPFYIAYAANHADLSLPFYTAIGESLPYARAMARKRGWKGVHFPVCIGPWGLHPEDPEQDWGQRSNAAYVALNYLWYWQYTQDTAFLREVGYPYLREVADFWEDYLKFEEGRYVIRNDSIHEGSGKDVNPILSLGLVRTLFKHIVPLSETLGVDAERRGKWRDISARLSAFPRQERGGKTVFRYTEQGTAWWNDNTLGIQHIFPAGAIGLDASPEELTVCHNTLTAMNRWHDNNGFSSWYTACARVGYEPRSILAHLREECDRQSYPNLLLQYGGGGLENISGFLAVNEMLLQSHEGVLHFFPVWPRDLDARFGGLRAVGAFLVSAELRNGAVGGVRIQSEKGRACAVVNPWPDRKVRLVRNGAVAETLEGARFNFTTVEKEDIQLKPEG